MSKNKKNKNILQKIVYRTGGLALMFLVLSVIVSCFFYDVNDSAYNLATSKDVNNLLGFYGARMSDFALTIFGLSMPIFLIAPLLWSVSLIKLEKLQDLYLRGFACLFGMFSFSLFLSFLPSLLGSFDLGGFVGKFFAIHLGSFISQYLTFIYSKEVVVSLLLVLAFVSFNFATGIGLNNWYRACRFVVMAIVKIIMIVAAGFAFVALKIKNRKNASLSPRKLKEKNVREKKEPKLKEPKEKEEKSKSKPKMVKSKKEPEKMVLNAPSLAEAYDKPTLDFLSPKSNKAKVGISEKELEKIALQLEDVLQEFGVNGKIVNKRVGPVVTLYELEPAPGTKTARVVGLADDIARSMSAKSVRIAVVSGSNKIGIEMPNSVREIVLLRELFDDKDFDNTKSALSITLGKDIGGKNIYADLAKMPHLLVAGTTGSGKSVGVNTMILSLLYRLSPEECKFIMIDPKMLEFSLYNGIPHLLTPVITDPSKAVVGLKWAVREMEDRYRAMAQLNVRNISGYNQKLAELRASGKSCTKTIQTGFDLETGKPLFEEQNMDLTALPYIVIVVDEMADLMLVAGKDVEAAIQRLAQMARAAGIHLIMSTQRPSVDVITGTIKANFPTRISFQVTSKIDSRTILGEQGAEQLLGMGDLLYMPAGQRPIRIHAGFVKDSEIENIVEFLKSQKEPQYIDAVTEGDLNDKGDKAVFDEGSFGGGGDDDLYSQALAIVRNDKKASTSYIQRKLRIGYNRAASIVDRMEEEGIISAADHVGRREVL